MAAARRALELRPAYPEARLVLSESLLRRGDEGEGRRELRRFVDEAPPELAAEQSHAEALLRKGPDRVHR